MEPGGRRAEGKGETGDAAAAKIPRTAEARAGSGLGCAARGGADPPRCGGQRAGAALLGAEETAGAKGGKGLDGEVNEPTWLGEGVCRAVSNKVLNNNVNSD